MRFLPIKEFRRLDLNSEEMGVPVSQLMAAAGRALAEHAAKLAPTGPVVIFCGKGNNGGDGYAAAAILRSSRDVTVVEMEPPTGAESQAAHAAAGDTIAWDRFDGSTQVALVLDCMLGSGLRGDVRAPYAQAIDWINQQRPKSAVLSCDVPSGLGTPCAVQPDVCVTFHAAKEGMTAESCGRIVVADIGIPEAAETHVGFGDLVMGYPMAAPSSHKGDNGVVLLVAGGPFTGAPYYAAVGAYRSGADLVAAFMPAETAASVRNYGPEPIVHDAGPGRRLSKQSVEPILEFLPTASALVIGPGLGTHRETLDAVQRILAEAALARTPTVIDADGLDGIPDGYWTSNGERTIITPHAQEFLDLTGNPANEETVAAFAKQTGCTVLLKGAEDLIASPTRIKRCTRGHPTMTVGGTGDVLAGAVGALLARGADRFDAAAAAAYLVGVAGESAARELGSGAVALDVADHIPEILARLQ